MSQIKRPLTNEEEEKKESKKKLKEESEEEEEDREEEEEEDETQKTFDLVSTVTLELKTKEPEAVLEQALVNLKAFRQNEEVKKVLKAKFPKIHFLPELKTEYFQVQDEGQDPVALSVHFATVYSKTEIGSTIYTTQQNIYYCPLTNLLFFDSEDTGIRVERLDQAANFATMLKKWHNGGLEYLSFEEYSKVEEEKQKKKQEQIAAAVKQHRRM